MKSGFLNVAAMASGSMSKESVSRNKRKFRADPPSPSPLPMPICTNCGINTHWIANGAPPIPSPCLATPPKTHRDHGQALPYFSPAPIPYNGAKLVHGSIDYSQTLRAESCEEEQEFEEPDEPDWDNYSEAQLESILINSLDLVYKDAIKKIISSGASEHDAFQAVLRNGRCYGGRDAVSTIVTNALAYIKNSEPGRESKEPVFIDLKQMEEYVLAEMIHVLRKVRPFLSRGDAMWCLLVSDLNVAHACAMEDDVIPTFKRDASPSLGLSEPKSVPSPSCVSANENCSSHQTPRPNITIFQPSSSSVSPHRDAPSAFSAPCFSSSSMGSAAPSCKQCYVDTSSSARSMHASTLRLSSKVSHPSQKDHLEAVNCMATSQLQLTTSSISQGQVNPSGCISDCSAGRQAGISTSDQLVCDSLESLSAVCSAATAPSLPLSSMGCFERLLLQYPLNQSALWSLNSGNCLSACASKSSSMAHFHIGTSDKVQTELQRENLAVYHSSYGEVRIDHNTMNDVTDLGSSGTELSLSLASVVDNGISEALSTARLDSDMEETTFCSLSHSIPTPTYFGWTDCEERMNGMLVQLFHRVKELESQLNEWTDWAQEKVMQAARRLSKDFAELKALRLEHAEYARLKKEKQALEESTIKKLSEMESALRKASSQVDRANAAVIRLEGENAEIRAKMEAAKLGAAESVVMCQEVTKREKKSLKKAQDWEKERAKLQAELAEMKQKVTLLEQQVSQTKERQQQAEVRWRQEKKAKEEAQLFADAERQAKEEAEINAKRREEALQRKSDADSQRHHDDIQMLEGEIAKFRMSSEVPLLKWENGYGIRLYNIDTYSARSLKQMNARLLREIADLQDMSQKEIYRDRECVMCMTEEMSVVFLPCAHQVVCVKCSELLENQGLQDCPSCRTPIQQKIRVFGVGS